MSYTPFLFSGFYKEFLKTGHKFHKFVPNLYRPLFVDEVRNSSLTN